ncbi:MAG: DUF4040 domain-containing protein [Spirochaetaceae bacterium]|nr:MAG: DUF4040 domain-containing protein [Spirochaetaceae bacterium]
MFELILFGIMIVLAFLAIETNILRKAVVFLGIFSLVTSFVYLYNNAPDVAIAEAVIGSALVTLLYLTALRRYKVYNICFTNEEFGTVVDRNIIEGTRRGQLLRDIENICLNRELEPQIVYTPDPLESVKARGIYDLIIRQEKDSITVYGHRDNYFVDELEMFLILRYKDLECTFVRFGDDGDDDEEQIA